MSKILSVELFSHCIKGKLMLNRIIIAGLVILFQIQAIGQSFVAVKQADKYFESNALDAWLDENGNEPDGTATIGIIYVKE